jgi:hypothetical protein
MCEAQALRSIAGANKDLFPAAAAFDFFAVQQIHGIPRPSDILSLLSNFGRLTVPQLCGPE